MDGVVAVIDIQGRKVGPGCPCFIVAEAGVNHNGSLESAMDMIDAAAGAGADAVKFQTFRAERVIAPGAPKADYQLLTTPPEESQLDLLKRLELPFEAFRDLFEHCRKRKILFMSTPFDEESADFLRDLGVAVFKIPSGEITNTPFLSHVAGLGRPLILSTGMSFLGEVEAALSAVRKTGNHDVALMHCVSRYPARPSEINLRAMGTMAAAFGTPVGYSDHTPGKEISLAAVALGACIIEKHFTLDRTLPGPDHQASLEPGELMDLVKGIRSVEAALGDGIKRPAEGEENTAKAARRSLTAARDLAAGTLIAEEDVLIRRPGTGLAPGMLPMILGRTLREDAPAGTPLTLEMLS